uniref:Uncharacterized protein n=1 Tax=Anser brachyrhynchus TaxID=132585 RepID=A0A8B9BDS2_9AVES
RRRRRRRRGCPQPWPCCCPRSDKEHRGPAGTEGSGSPAVGLLRGPSGRARVFKMVSPCLHKTPKRSLSRKSRIPTFSSPVNDTDIQQEIFWDPHSPIARGLGNIKNTQTSGCLSEECNWHYHIY